MNSLSKKIFNQIEERGHNAGCALLRAENQQAIKCPIDHPQLKDGGCMTCRIRRVYNEKTYMEQTQDRYSLYHYDMETFNAIADLLKGTWNPQGRQQGA